MAKIEITIDEIIELYTHYFEAEKLPIRNIVAIDSKTARGNVTIPSLSMNFQVTLTYDSYMKPNVLFKVLSKNPLIKKIMPFINRRIEQYQNNVVSFKMPYIIVDTESALKKYADYLQLLDIDHDGDKFILDVGVKNL